MTEKINIQLKKTKMKKKESNQEKLKRVLEQGQKAYEVINKWHEIIRERRQVKSYTTIVGDRLYVVEPREDEIIMPFAEDFGDHGLAFLVTINIKTNKEVARKSLRTVDIIEWNLSSF